MTNAKRLNQLAALVAGVALFALTMPTLIGDLSGPTSLEPCNKPADILCPHSNVWTRCSSQPWEAGCNATTNAKQPYRGDFGTSPSDSEDSEQDGTLANCYGTGSCKWGQPPLAARCFGDPATWTFHEAQIYVSMYCEDDGDDGGVGGEPPSSLSDIDP